jgi:hypothetical protein
VALSTKDRTQIYTRLAPMIGEKEAETLLDQFPSRAGAELVTMADLKAVEARLDHRMDLLEQRVAATIEKAMRRQLIWLVVAMFTMLQLIARTSLFG